MSARITITRLAMREYMVARYAVLRAPEKYTPATVWRNVTPTFVWKALQREALPLDNGGKSSRDFIFVEDMAEGLMRCALAGESGGVYNLASGKETTIAELAHIVNEVTGNPTPSELRPTRAWDRSGKRFGCTKKSERELGFIAKTNLKEGIKKTVEWTIRNSSTIEKAIAKHDVKMPAP